MRPVRAKALIINAFEGVLTHTQQSMIQILLLVMMICIRLGAAEAGDLRYL